MRPCTACASWSRHILSACAVQLKLGRSGTLARQSGVLCAHPGHALAFRQVAGWHDAERHAVRSSPKAVAALKAVSGQAREGPRPDTVSVRLSGVPAEQCRSLTPHQAPRTNQSGRKERQGRKQPTVQGFLKGQPLFCCAAAPKHARTGRLPTHKRAS